MRKGIRNGIAAGLILLGLSACTDQLKEDVEALRQPVPSGLVLLTDSVKVVKGEEFEVVFRVNPSGAVLSKENVELDVMKSDVYLLFEPESGKPVNSKASYVTPSAYMECVELKPCVNAQNEPLEGQWVLRVKTKVEENQISFSDLKLVVNYVDLRGERQYVSSSDEMNVEIWPTVDEGVFLGYSKAQTYRANSTQKVLPYQVLVDCNFYKNAAGRELKYDLGLISKMDFTLNNETEQLFTVENKVKEGRVVLVPDEGSKKWSDFEKSEDLFVSTTGTIVLTDVAENTKSRLLEMAYYKSEVTAVWTFSAAELNKTKESPIIKDAAELLSKVGLTSDFNRGIRRKVMGASHIHDVEFSGEGLWVNGYDFLFNKWDQPFRGNVKIAGFYPLSPDGGEPGDISVYMPVLRTVSQNLGEWVSLFDMKIRLTLRVTE